MNKKYSDRERYWASQMAYRNIMHTNLESIRLHK